MQANEASDPAVLCSEVDHAEPLFLTAWIISRDADALPVFPTGARTDGPTALFLQLCPVPFQRNTLDTQLTLQK